MEQKGAVICFQKYVLGRSRDEADFAASDGPVCLGYMDRIDVTAVSDFKGYIQIASQHGAEYSCTRKQLLIYKIDDKFDSSINIVTSRGGAGAPHDGRIPFYSAGTKCFFGLCCCSVLNISPALRSKPLYEIADHLYNTLKAFQAGTQQELEFAITGLLGGEDLCLIILSDHFSAVSDAFSSIQQLEMKGCPVLDNTHSMLMMDRSGLNCNWGDARAQILFSTKSKTGLAHVKSIYDSLYEQDNTVSFDGTYGEYDVVIRCPARLLTGELYTDNGLLSYRSAAYQNAVYQSETQIFPFGGKDILSSFFPPADAESRPTFVTKNDLEDAMQEITENILGTEIDAHNDLTHIRSSLYRLLKDYCCITADPFNVRIHRDLTTQFRTAVSALRLASKSSFEEFNTMFDRIINALNGAMHIASQQDRFCFDEQPSHLQNLGSYYKILLAYYGFIKDVLQLLYSVRRDENSVQHTLIPLISFGMTPIIESFGYDAEYTGEASTPVPAKLLCIMLPYQALANPPKYLGILVHEVFHYIDDQQAGLWNQSLTVCVVKLAICEFLDLLAESFADDGHRYSFSSQGAYSEVIDKAAETISEELFYILPEMRFMDIEKLRRTLFRYLNFRKNKKDEAYGFYRGIWKNLRAQFASIKAEETITRVFALSEKGGEDTIFDGCIQKVKDFEPFYKILPSYYDAFLEVTADLFNVGIVLCGRDRESCARQFMWQIYSTRSDRWYGNEYSERADLHNEHLTLNLIRFGIMMDHLLNLSPDKVEGVSQLAAYLKTWCVHKSETSDRFEQMQVTFRREYLIYREHRSLYTEQAKNYLKNIETAIESLNQNPACAGVMKTISELYQNYYTMLEDWHKDNLLKDDLNEKAFDLCTGFITRYQQQPDICELKNPGVAKRPAGTKAAIQFPRNMIENPIIRFYADYPEDLSWQVRLAAKKMTVNEKLPVIWYRGQRNKHIETLPGMFRDGSSSALKRLRQSIRLARAQILPYGMEFEKSEWLAYLQHNGFETNILDFSESFYPSLYFAIKDWVDEPKTRPEYDSHISMLNPILFNLAMRALDKGGSKNTGLPEWKKLREYLKTGTLESGPYLELPLFARGEECKLAYPQYFSWDMEEAASYELLRPMAVLTPKNSERMKKQIGQFIFYDLNCKVDPPGKDKATVRKNSMEALHQDYLDMLEQHNKDHPDDPLPLPFPPFLCEININRFASESFVKYVKAIGLRKYHVYPEVDKLEKDISQLLRGVN